MNYECKTWQYTTIQYKKLCGMDDVHRIAETLMNTTCSDKQ